LPNDSDHQATGFGAASSLAVDEQYIRNALDLAREAAKRNEVPIGAVIVREGAIIAATSNRTVRDQDPTAHAELLAIREASSKLDRWRLDDCTLYVTLEPCAMCAGAIVLSRVRRVVFGAWDEKAGMAGSVGDLLRNPRLNHRPEVRSGVLAATCGGLLEAFFRTQRRVPDEAKDPRSGLPGPSGVNRA
jgi:tRNA(adenine34) deaminase